MHFCEATGAIHYFASTERATEVFLKIPKGAKTTQAQSHSNITGGKDIYDAFPYEYKTPQLMPVHFEVNIR
ncbi:MAG: hypothetical protein HS118_13400 [Bacteroidia bacterium]|nr:hypothetical protein [Bacteroidia bacterium]